MSVLLQMKNVCKEFPGVKALEDVQFELKEGEVHALLGENGAGKSTLMKIIYGIESPSEGEVIHKGEKVKFRGSMEAIHAGIGMVHQHFMLIPTMSVVENIIVGDEPSNIRGIVDYKEAVKRTRELSEHYHLDVDVLSKIEDLSAGEKQKVEILKTLYRNAEIIILDEPTSVLTPQETETLFEELFKLKEMGHTIIFISHKLNEVKRISDRITVIRSGECKGTFENDEVDLLQLAELIVGRKLLSSYSELKKDVDDKKEILRVEKLYLSNKEKNILENISFSIRSGEILGIAGVQGNGQSELVRAIAGIGPMSSGEISLSGQRIEKLSVKKRRELGLSYIPEDRLGVGVATTAPLCDNIISSYYDRADINGHFFMDRRKISETANNLISKFTIRTNSIYTAVGDLSGGNMQKVVVARESNTDPICMLAEQPTQGIDIGSSEYIRTQLIEMRNRGAAVLLISADLEEVLSLSDRVIVMYNGMISAHLSNLDKISTNDLGLYMLGIRKQTSDELKEALYE